MHAVNTEVITLRKLKKDGSIDSRAYERILYHLRQGDPVIYPVDWIYGVMVAAPARTPGEMESLSNEKSERITTLISNFKMLDGLVTMDKLQFDFLHRVWPGEITVHLRQKEKNLLPMPVRIPRNKFQLELISDLGSPVFFSTLYEQKGKKIYREKDLISKFSGHVGLIVIINEFCKNHVKPSVVDVTGGDLRILYEGRVPEDEIKSLYFLGMDDFE